MSASRRRWGRVVAACLLAAVALFLAAEVALRVLYREPLMLYTRPDIYERHRAFGYRYRANAVSEICIPSICKPVRINANGFYGPMLSGEPVLGELRIAIVDASNGTGIWLAGDEMYSAVLQSLLDEASVPAQVGNFAIDGSDRDLANLRLVENIVLDYAPDLVLLSVHPPISGGVVFREYYRGYIFEAGTPEFSATEIRRLRKTVQRYIDELEDMWLVDLYRLSYVVRALHRMDLFEAPERTENLSHDNLQQSLESFQAKRISLAFQLPEYGMAQSLERIRRTQELVEARGAKLVLFRYGESAELDLIAEKLGLDVIAMVVPTSAEFVHEHDGHFNLRGHRRIAEGLLSGLRELGLIER